MMTTLKNMALVIAVLLLMSPPAAIATGAGARPDTRARASSRRATTSGVVLGNAWKGDNTPIAYARLRLRNVSTGHAEASSVADVEGQFTFQNVAPGSYIVELVNNGGKVIAISQVFEVAPGETTATFVRLASRTPWGAALFSNIATAAITAASSLGVTALGSNGQPVSAAAGSGQ